LSAVRSRRLQGDYEPRPTTSEHMNILCQAGLTRPKRIKKWIFYKRNEVKIRQIKKVIPAKV
jgi:hypothetical protein